MVVRVETGRPSSGAHASRSTDDTRASGEYRKMRQVTTTTTITTTATTTTTTTTSTSTTTSRYDVAFVVDALRSCRLLVVCYLLLTACYIHTYDLLLGTCYLLFVICYCNLLLATCYLLTRFTTQLLVRLSLRFGQTSARAHAIAVAIATYS